ncbi:hypothetical protein [Roseivirga pacifica]
MQTQQGIFPSWMRGVLLAATAYNVLWGILISSSPNSFYSWVLESTDLIAPEVIRWQGRGVLLMAVVYFASALYPNKVWFFPFVGAFTKLAGGIWFYFVVLEKQINNHAIFHLLINDAVWIPLLIYIGIKAIAYKKLKS